MLKCGYLVPVGILWGIQEIQTELTLLLRTASPFMVIRWSPGVIPPSISDSSRVLMLMQLKWILNVVGHKELVTCLGTEYRCLDFPPSILVANEFIFFLIIFCVCVHPVNLPEQVFTWFHSARHGLPSQFSLGACFGFSFEFSFDFFSSFSLSLFLFSFLSLFH